MDRPEVESFKTLALYMSATMDNKDQKDAREVLKDAISEVQALESYCDKQAEEIERLSKRDGDATIELCYKNEEGFPWERETLGHCDFGVSDNIYVVESKIMAERLSKIKQLEADKRELIEELETAQETITRYRQQASMIKSAWEDAKIENKQLLEQINRMEAKNE